MQPGKDPRQLERLFLRIDFTRNCRNALDDARIEKLVSRLRAKIEPDPTNPRYLTTLRGRGYKLVGVP